MANFYQDASRYRLFAERGRERGPLSGPEMCQVDLLEWSPGTHFAASSPCSSIKVLFACTHAPLLGQVTRHPRVVETDARALRSRPQPRLQIMYGSSL